MPTTATFRAKIDPEKKALVDNIYKSLGTTTAEAFRIFVQKSIDVNGFPFALTLDDNPTTTTLAAYDEADEIAKTFKIQRYTGIHQMIGDDA